MKLNRNARTCPNSQALIARVFGRGWTLAVGGRGRRRERADGQEVGRRGGRRSRLVDRSSAPKRVPHRTPPGASRRSGRCAGCA